MKRYFFQSVIVLSAALLPLACGRDGRNPDDDDNAAGGIDAAGGSSADTGGSVGTGGEDATGGMGGMLDNPKECQSSDPCFSSTLDPSTDECVTEPKPGASCDDEDACTDDDQCDDEGDCAGQALDCDDGLGCTVDSCDSKVGCLHPTDPEQCNDNDPCTSDICTDEGACDHEASSGNTCGDSDCVAQAVCQSGVCETVPADSVGVCYPASIDFGDVIVGMTNIQALEIEAKEGPFTLSSATTPHAELSFDTPALPYALAQDEELDIKVSWTPQIEGALDTNVQLNTGKFTWHVQATGTALPQPDCDDDNSCTADSFDTTLGECVHDATDGATCDDGNTCTQTDVCQEDSCVGSDFMDCPDGEVCISGAGMCVREWCMDPASLSATCSTYAAPFGEGCACQLIWEHAPESLHERLTGILSQPEYQQAPLVSMLLMEIVRIGWALDLTGPDDAANAAIVLQALSTWDLSETLDVEPLNTGPLDLDDTVGALQIYFQTYEGLNQAVQAGGADLGDLKEILSSPEFSPPSRDRFRYLGMAGQTATLVKRLLIPDATDPPADVIASFLSTTIDSQATDLLTILSFVAGDVPGYPPKP